METLSPSPSLFPVLCFVFGGSRSVDRQAFSPFFAVKDWHEPTLPFPPHRQVMVTAGRSTTPFFFSQVLDKSRQTRFSRVFPPPPPLRAVLPNGSVMNLGGNPCSAPHSPLFLPTPVNVQVTPLPFLPREKITNKVALL